jgi:hypothetical protein
MGPLKELTLEIHVVQCLCHDIIGLVLGFMRAHAIHERIGTHELLHGTAPSDEVLGIELGGEGRCLYHEIEHLHGDTLFALLKDMPQQGVFERLQLPSKRSGVIGLPPAL